MNLHVFDGRLKDVCIDQQQIGRLPEKRASINFKQQKLDTAIAKQTKKHGNWDNLGICGRKNQGCGQPRQITQIGPINIQAETR